MGKSLALVALACTTAGCLWDKKAADKPARLHMGFNTRRVVTEPPKRELAGGVLARTTTPGETDDPAIASTGVTGSAQFTMENRRGFYLGGEVEAGPLTRSGSFFGGAYGVAGAETASERGSLSVELIAGRRWVRYELGADDVASLALEPRVRGQLWLGPQVSFGGVIGANAVPGEAGWMAGIYLGIYSDDRHGAR
ncbi:MAG: hypothetical protein JNL83_39765 [Myxococcales bacterium]|nr:hypothetical protein [Myxococcales bacterium]